MRVPVSAKFFLHCEWAEFIAFDFSEFLAFCALATGVGGRLGPALAKVACTDSAKMKAREAAAIAASHHRSRRHRLAIASGRARYRRYRARRSA